MRILLEFAKILIIFIVGFILGKIEKRFIDIGMISSIITLVLFIFFIFSKAILINQTKMTLTETIDVSYNKSKKNYKIIENVNVSEINDEKIYITPTKPLRYLKIYEFGVNKFKKGKVVYEKGFIRNGHTICLNTHLNEGIPSYVVEYQRFDFVLVEFTLAENGKNGLLEDNLSIKHTFKSFIYYLVK